ncbi:hypothetical protein [Acetivibrio cellulolyticus]|uniref:hypothetical protein n=1 Tax=Acetivibrio cellulolyticus TaxID=35830 RepID=UPI0001E2DEC1|nr:hypothetical protein [Acetivibrio cellulolyticus]
MEIDLIKIENLALRQEYVEEYRCKNIGYERVFLRTETASEYYRKRGWIFSEDVIDEYGEETSVFYREGL